MRTLCAVALLAALSSVASEAQEQQYRYVAKVSPTLVYFDRGKEVINVDDRLLVFRPNPRGAGFSKVAHLVVLRLIDKLAIASIGQVTDGQTIETLDIVVTAARWASMDMAGNKEVANGNGQTEPAAPEVPAGFPGRTGATVTADTARMVHVGNGGFWLDRTEVTVQDFRRFAGAVGRAMPPAPEAAFTETCPITNVTLADAEAYCAWAGKRLPTSSEWVRACRGERGSEEFPWGSDPPDSTQANTYDNGSWRLDLKALQPVGSYPAGATHDGALDMIGNAWEWTASRAVSQWGEEQATVYGSSFGDLYMECGAGRQYSVDFVRDDIGFRCARD